MEHVTKHAIDRALVHPMSNLIATQQVRSGDLIKLDFDSDANQITFAKEAEGIHAWAMVQMIQASAPPIAQFSAGTTQQFRPSPRAAAHSQDER